MLYVFFVHIKIFTTCYTILSKANSKTMKANKQTNKPKSNFLSKLFLTNKHRKKGQYPLPKNVGVSPREK